MIKSIHLKNFQAHADTKVEFGPVTTFIGGSDEGKSTVAFKALKLALTGQNWDPGWLRDTPVQTTEGTIEAVLDDGSIVHRTRTETGQIVRLTDADGQTERYTKIKGVEPFILALTKLRKVVLDSQDGPEDLNFIRNGQRPFLIENDPEVVQRKVVGILQCNEIESAKIRLNKRLNQKLSDQKYWKEENDRLVTRLQALVAIREKVHQVDNTLDDAIDRHQQTDYKIELLRDLRESFHLYRYTDLKASLARQLITLVLKAQQLSEQIRLLKEARIQQRLTDLHIYETSRLKELTAVQGYNVTVSARQELQELTYILQQQVLEQTIVDHETLLSQGRCPTCGTMFSVT